MRMTQAEFDREKRYQVVMHFVRKMLHDGLISEEEYRQIDTKNRLELHPKTGDLISQNLSPPHRSLSPGKGSPHTPGFLWLRS